MRLPMALALALLTPACTPVLKAEAQRMHNLKIQDAVADYQNAPTPLDRCVKAKLVAVAYEDAGETANGRAWRSREREDCETAVAAMGFRPQASRPGG
jgi:hypothetical protein